MITQLQQDLIEAMKAKDDTRVGTLRLLLSSVKNRQIEVGHDLSEDEFLAVVQREVKQRKDSIAQYQQAERDDLAEEEQAELNILMSYMPEQMSEEELSAEVDKAIAAAGASSMADMGKVMGELSGLKGKADMGEASKLVREKLAA